jgi:hypothetical protein
MSIQRPFVSIAAARGVWLLRWLLVLLIAFDQVGSPLHRHHHDSGVDAAHWVPGAAGASSVGLHILRERDDPGRTIFHANTAVRSEARLLLGSGPEAADTERLVALIWPEPRLALAALHAPLAAPADTAPPPPASWHELLPEGRAPPQRA